MGSQNAVPLHAAASPTEVPLPCSLLIRPKRIKQPAVVRLPCPSSFTVPSDAAPLHLCRLNDSACFDRLVVRARFCSTCPHNCRVFSPTPARRRQSPPDHAHGVVIVPPAHCLARRPVRRIPDAQVQRFRVQVSEGPSYLTKHLPVECSFRMTRLRYLLGLLLRAPDAPITLSTPLMEGSWISLVRQDSRWHQHITPDNVSISDPDDLEPWSVLVQSPRWRRVLRRAKHAILSPSSGIQSAPAVVEAASTTRCTTCAVCAV